MVTDDDENVENLSLIFNLSIFIFNIIFICNQNILKVVVHNSDVAQYNKPFKTASGQWGLTLCFDSVFWHHELIN